MRIPFASMLAVLLVPALAAADPFAGYRIPDHHWRGGTLGLQTSGTSLTNPSAPDTKDGDLFGRLAGRWMQGWDSDALNWNIGAGVGGQIDSRATDDNQEILPGLPATDHTYDRARDGDWGIGGSLTTYPFAPPLGLAVGGNLQGQNRRMWSTEDIAIGDPPVDGSELHIERDNRLQQLDAIGFAAAGVGHVRDATVVYDAHVMEQRLRDEGVLTRPLSPAARERLAALLAVAPSFVVVHERPDRFEWREIERVLREDGALGPQGLDARAAMKASEDYRVGSLQRLTGWFAGPRIAGTHGRWTTQATTDATSRTYVAGSLTDESSYQDALSDDQSEDVLWAGGQAEWHHALGWEQQLDAMAVVQAPVRSGESGLDATTGVSVGWLVAERWSATGRVQYGRHYFSPRGADGVLQDDRWTLGCGIEARYHIEDRLSLSLSLYDAQMRDHPVDSGTGESYRTFQHQSRLQLALSYAFLGRLEAPGIMSPMTPVR
jgi:hypothetical protein